MDLKEKFTKWLCPLVFMDGNGFKFPYARVMHDPKLKYIFNDPNYKTLKRKMKNFLKLINKDINVGYIDIETELWYKI